MKIGILISNISANIAGLERYQIEILRRLVNLRSKDQFIIYKKPGVNMDYYNFFDNTKFKVINLPGGKLWKHLGMILVPKADIYLFSDPNIPIFLNSKKIIVIVHDLYHFIFKVNNIRNKVNNFIWRKAFEKAAKVVPVSNNTKQDLLKYVNIEVDKIKLIYNGFNKFKKLEHTGRKENFFLTVGTVKLRKNILNIIKAFNLFLKESSNRDIKLLVVGKYSKSSDYYKNISEYIKQNNIEDRVIFLGNVDDQELANLYYSAKALIFTSLFEGFGFPILEAMYCKTPVITSNIGSMKEIGGGASLLADPNSPEDIAKQILNIYNNKELRQKLILKGKEKASQFSWEKASQEMSNLIDEVYERK